MGTKPSIPVQPYVPFVHPPVTPSRPLRRVCVIANPFSGGGQGRVRTQALTQILTDTHKLQVDVRYTTHAGHAIEIAASLDVERDGIDAVVGVGGDGTAHEVINGLLYGAHMRVRGADATNVPPVLLVPCGSGNTLAFNIGLVTMEDAIRSLLAYRPYLMDVVEMTSPEDVSVPQIPMACIGSGDSARHIAGARGTGAAGADGAGGLGLAAITGGMHPAAAPVQGEAGSADAAVGGAAEGAAAQPGRSAVVDAASVQELRRRVRYSVNMIGWGLSSAVLDTANSLRWCGAAQYNCAAYHELIANHNWVAGLDWVDPGYPLTIDATAFQDAARSVKLATGGSRTSKSAGSATAARSADADRGGVAESKVDDGSRAPDVSRAPAAADGAALIPLSPPTSDVSPYLMLQVQNTTYMGEKVAFCPFAKLDDGLMDICAVRPAGRLELVALMEAAKASGRHVLGPASGRGSPHAAIQYAQAREMVLYPLNADQTRAWKGGQEFVTSRRGIEYGSEAANAETLRARARERTRFNVADEPMIGPASVNIDGELSGVSPVRLRVLARVVPMLCAPKLAE